MAHPHGSDSISPERKSAAAIHTVQEFSSSSNPSEHPSAPSLRGCECRANARLDRHASFDHLNTLMSGDEAADSPRSATSTPSTVEHSSGVPSGMTKVTSTAQGRSDSLPVNRLLHGKRRSRSRKLLPTVEGDKVIAERFRTKLCRNYLQRPDRPCPYEDRCMFAHGDHELRTAAQNVADGLTSEEAIREFKRKLHHDATGLNGSGRSSPAQSVRQKKPSFSTSYSSEWLPRSSSHSILQDLDNDSASNIAGAHQLRMLHSPAPSQKQQQQHPHQGMLLLHSYGSVMNIPPPVGSQGIDEGEARLQPQPHGTALDAPHSAVFMSNATSTSTSASSSTYIHNPYAWRAI